MPETPKWCYLRPDCWHWRATDEAVLVIAVPARRAWVKYYQPNEDLEARCDLGKFLPWSHSLVRRLINCGRTGFQCWRELVHGMGGREKRSCCNLQSIYGVRHKEWDLLESSSKQSYETAIKALVDELNLDGKAVAAQDFRHMSQRAGETVSEFVSRLKKTFCKAYVHESITTETRNTLLYGGYGLLKAPLVSGATNCTQLCVAARNEEGR